MERVRSQMLLLRQNLFDLTDLSSTSAKSSLPNEMAHFGGGVKNVTLENQKVGGSAYI